jgi:hypothetical protein
VVAERVVALSPSSASVYGPAPEWQLVRVQRARPGAPSGATAVRAVVDRGQVAVIGPVAMASRSLRAVLAGTRALVSPPQLPLLRCTAPARVAAGVAEPPDVVIGFELRDRVVEIPELSSDTSPWFLAPDAQPMRTLVGWWTDDHAFAVQVPDPDATPARR